MTERYACIRCGTVFATGTGPDNIHEAEAGVSKTPHRGHDLDHVSKREAEVYDAFRAGKCPVCREVSQMMVRVDEDERPDRDELLERLAALEHQQWMEWSKEVADEVAPERRERWEKYWVPYEELPDDVQEADRKWARKVLEEVP